MSIELKQILEWLISETGMNFPDAHNSMVMESAMFLSRQNKLSLTDWFNLLLHNVDMQEAFINEVTIAETYFFRDEKQFKILRDTIFPRLLNSKLADGDNAHINIWSASCATGEEAIALAVAAMEFMPNVDFTVVASDINSLNLDKLSTGIFQSNSFREDGSSFHYLLNQHTPTTNGNWVLPETIRNHIKVERINILKDKVKSYPEDGFDLVFFRNTMLYMRGESKNQALNNILSHMKPGAFLFTSSTEVPSVMHQNLEVKEAGGTYFFIAKEKDFALPKQDKYSNTNQAAANKQTKTENTKHNKPQPTHNYSKPMLARFDIIQCLSELAKHQSTDSVQNKNTSANISPISLELLDILNDINNSVPTKAIKKINALESKTGENEISRYLAGLAFQHLDDTDAALSALKRAIAHNADFWPAWFTRAMIEMSTAPKQSVTSFSECIKRLDLDYAAIYGSLTENFDIEYFRTMSLGLIRKLELRIEAN